MRSKILNTSGRPLLLAALLSAGLGGNVAAQETHGWIGIDFDDEHCRTEKQASGEPYWVCSVPPVVNKVWEIGPAYAAGMRAGDVIIAIDGFDILTAEGGRLFANIQRGVPLTFQLRRANEELAVTVTPASKEEAFGADAEWIPVEPDPYDSLQIHMRLLFEGQMRLNSALREAEAALRRSEVQLRANPSEVQRVQVRQLRLQIDSINSRLLESQQQIRIQADSLAARAWIVIPERLIEVAPDITIAEPLAEARTITTVYTDAVAGARFEQLNQDNPLIEYFPGVEEGLLITRVVVDTPAHLAGLRAGDVVLSANGEPVSTVAELRRLMRGDVEITYVRKGRRRVCTIHAR